MGNNNSFPGFTEDLLDDYATLTYLNKFEILRLLKKFLVFGREEMNHNFHYRFPCEVILEYFPNLKYNPFIYRICQVFSSYKDGCFSFEDMLDLCSILSQNCPETVKAKWAFRIFDFDEDGKINEDDISKTIDLLTGKNKIETPNKLYIAKILLEEMNIQKTGGITVMEFEHAVGKMSEFAQTFQFTI